MKKSKIKNRKSKLLCGLQPCPGLRAGIFTDRRGRAHDLAAEVPLAPKTVAGTHGLPDSARGVLALVRTRQLYPVLRLNARVLRIYPCGVQDYWHRHAA